MIILPRQVPAFLEEYFAARKPELHSMTREGFAKLIVEIVDALKMTGFRNVGDRQVKVEVFKWLGLYVPTDVLAFYAQPARMPGGSPS